MNGKTQGAFLLLSSILISSTLSYLLTKARYEKKIVKPAQKQEPVQKPEQKKSTDLQEKEDITKYAEKYKQKFTELTKEYAPDHEEHKTREFIDADIFGSNDEFDTVTWTIYADDILVDEMDHIINDPDKNVGSDVVENFDEFQHDNTVYIRNYDTKLDYKIVRDLRTYAEVIGGPEYAGS